MPNKSTNPSQSDLQQVAQDLAEGKKGAIGRLYAWYAHRLRQYGLQIVGSEHKDMVMTVVQDFFMWLVKNPTSLKKVKKIDAFIFKSIRNNLLQAQQKAQKKQQVRSDYRSTISQQPTVENPSPERQLIDQEAQNQQRALVSKVLQSLPTIQREVLFLRYFQDLSYKSIGELLLVDEQVARNYAYRAIKKLKGSRLNHDE
ncbi:MAG: sigma-70 family RNA polymerase sigma factor [Bacteroidota bacterium]